MTFGLLELGILLFVIFLILGPKRIQNLLGAAGRGIRDFTDELGRDKEDRKMLGGGEDEDERK